MADVETVPTPRRGMRFRHARYRQTIPGVRCADSPFAVCRVTRVTATTVFYRAADEAGRATDHIARDRFHDVSVGEYL